MPTLPPKQRLVFGATGWALDFAGCEPIVADLPAVFRGWRIAVGNTGDKRSIPPRGTISRQGDGWHWREQGAPRARSWDRVPPKTPMRVITDVHEAAISWFLADHPDYLCLHGGAVKLGGGLVCFPAKGRTGKSTLIANLAAHGHKVFCDDVLGLAPPAERGVSLGLQPRLRVPLPAILKPEVRRFIAAHSGPVDASWHYLKLGKGQIADLGESAPIKAFVILERLDNGRAEFSSAGTAEVLKDIIAENIIRKLPMAEIFARLHKLASTRQRLRLRYSDPDDAARLLAEEFA
jgi:hypothetical protein